MTKAQESASQVAVFPSAPRSQETIEPMMPGRAAAALPAKLARARPRACRFFFTHSLTPPLSDGLGAGDGVPPAPPPVRARTSVLIAMPIAVRMLTVVIPCSRKSVRMRSASLSSSWRSRLMVSRIWFIWDRRAPRFVETASSLACLSSWMSESSPCNFSFCLESLLEFRCRPFRSVFGVPWPSAFRLRTSGRRWRLASRGC